MNSTMIRLFFYVYLIVTTTSALHLTQLQWRQTRSILMNPGITVEMKENIREIIYNKYSDWAIRQASLFKKQHYNRCKHMHSDELEIYALKGLVKSIQNYNPAFSFYPYLQKYIFGYLYIGLTELMPLNNIPGYKRRNRLENYKLYKRMIPIMVSPEDYWQIEKKQKESGLMIDSIIKKEKLQNIWKKVHQLDNPLQISIFKYKYDSQLDKIRSNKEVAELVCYSEEMVRQNIKNIVHTLSMQNKV